MYFYINNKIRFPILVPRKYAKKLVSFLVYCVMCLVPRNSNPRYWVWSLQSSAVTLSTKRLGPSLLPSYSESYTRAPLGPEQGSMRHQFFPSVLRPLLWETDLVNLFVLNCSSSPLSYSISWAHIANPTSTACWYIWTNTLTSSQVHMMFHILQLVKIIVWTCVFKALLKIIVLSCTKATKISGK